MTRITLLLVCMVGGPALHAATPARLAPLSFSLLKLGQANSGRAVLVVGGIQGDEPGGFNAASLLATRYRIRGAALWVVPNLNFPSIVQRSRGTHGDMNRKFRRVARDDPDFEPVQRIKAIITAPEVDYILNLHDGSGFYRPTYIDKARNPRRWGQSIIIDQERIDVRGNGELGSLARAVADEVNARIEVPKHAYHIRNTKTRDGNREMAKTLTYYAINQAKPAVGIEASKALPTHLRVYYHLRVIEAYLRRLGLAIERDFELSPEGVKRAIDDNPRLSFYGHRLMLDMRRARKRLAYIPLRKDGPIEFRASSPLVALTRAAHGYRVSYGNRRVTQLDVQPFDYDASLDGISMRVDGRTTAVTFGSVVDVAHEFEVATQLGYRVNVIGWRRRGVRDESGHAIRRADIAPRFSVDRGATLFRVEVYRGPKFTGMVLARFGGQADAARRTRPAVYTASRELDDAASGAAGR